MSERNLIDKSQENDYTVTTVQPGEQRPPEPEIRYSRGDGTPRAFGSYCWPLQVAMRFGSCATGVCEPCQVGNKAALNRISRVPQGCLAELTVKVTDMGFGSKRAARSLKKRTVFREKPGRIWASGGRGFLRTLSLPENLEKLLTDCTLCPRNCHVNRMAGQIGYCLQTGKLRAARAALHYWEEPCISGTAGSGAVFFGGCSMRCVFCQNHDIAAGEAGREISLERLKEIFLELQEKGANNINLVTPTHFVPLIVPALRAAKREGLRIPIVYNTSSYEKVSTLQLLDGLVDIYLPDLKYESAALSGLLSNAPDYFETATAAIAEMVRQVGEPGFAAPDGTQLFAAQMNDACEEADEDAEFLMKKGVIVRHLALPGQEADSKRVLSYLLKTYGERIYISLMNQYTPIPSVLEKTLPKLAQKKLAAPEPLREKSAAQPESAQACLTGLQRRLTEDEYEALIDFAIENGIENGFIQDQETAQESFIPAFDGEGI